MNSYISIANFFNMSKISLETMRHSASHLMAAAILELYPEVKFGIGPAIANGFYYDLDLPFSLTPEHLKKIEKKMNELKKRNLKFEKSELTIKEAGELFKKLDQPYKLELINDLEKTGTTNKKLESKPPLKVRPRINIYRLGNFIDLCKGPHVESTKEIGAFRLRKIAGAYWRGDEKNKMLQRIYGLAFLTEKDLQEYLKFEEEVAKRDHRRLGKDLDLFSFDEEVGAGLPLWHPKGALIRQIIEDFWIQEHLKNGYELVRSPHIGNLNLWSRSGHLEFYKDYLYSPIQIEDEKYLIKPMNCPFHIKIYKSTIRSYRDLPLRWAELGTVYRYEKSGVLHGLLRVRGFTQDDAHIFCSPEDLNKEIGRVLNFSLKMLRTFGFKKFEIYLSTRPEKYVGDLSNWEKATSALKNALVKSKENYQIEAGEGAFYGPKIDIKIKDSLGRAWQCSTIQVDFNLPERFDVFYIDKKGKKIQPIMIHRALLGSLERFFAVLLENYVGALPLWLSPIQIYLAPVGKKHYQATRKLTQEFESYGLRCWNDELRETISYKIRKAEKQKIPYILVIGDREIKSKSLNVRIRGRGVIKINKERFIKKVRQEIENKS